jgi:hypothetical protein
LSVLFWREHQQKKAFEEQTQEMITSTEARLDSISADLNTKIATIKKMGGDITLLETAKRQLEADKEALKNLTGFSIKKYEDKIRGYVMLLKQKDAEIATLKQENGQLLAKNDSLSREAMILIEGFQSAKQILSDTMSKMNAVVAEQNARVQEIAEQNRELNEKVAVAAALRAENINVYAISPKGKESEGGIYRSKKVDKIRITFYLQENPVARKDNKDVYLRILDHRGAIVSDMQTGSGTFSYKSKETIFTARQRINYSDTHQMVEFVYNRGLEYQPGKHVIELYCEGHRIGETVFEVK